MKLLLLITFLATALRLFFFSDFHDCCGSDEGVYHYIAQNLAFNNTFVINEQKLEPWKEEIYGAKPPLYPFFIAGIYKFISPDIKAVEIFQVLLSAITGFLIYLIGKELLSKKVGVIALVIYSFFLETAFMSVLLLSENIYWLLLSFYIYLLIRIKKGSVNLSVLIGIISGLLILIRPPSLIFIIPVLIWYLWKNLNFKTIVNAAAIVLFAFLTILPWTLRNYNVYKQFIFIYTDGGINVWMGNHEGASGGYQVVKADNPNQKPVLKTSGVMQEIERDSFYYTRAKEYVFSHPLQALDLSLVKVFNTFSLYRRAAVVYTINAAKTNNPLRPPIKSFNAALEFIVSYQYVLIILLTGFSLSYFYFKKLLTGPFVLICILILCHIISIAMTHSEFRYVMQLYPLIIPLAAAGVYIVQGTWASIRRKGFV